jgi:peroxiredoxin Q/BCP
LDLGQSADYTVLSVVEGVLTKEFGKLDAEIIGVSSDSVESHRRFAEKHNLSFTLLSDERGKVRRMYGVSNTFAIFPGRVT